MMKNSVMFCLNPFISHFYPLLTTMRKLDSIGYEVYLVGEASIEGFVKQEGFILEKFNTFSYEKFQKLKIEEDYDEIEKSFKKVHEEIECIIKKHSPTIVFMGISRQDWYYIPAYKCKCNIVLYSLCSGNPRLNIKDYPCTSCYQPKKVFNRLFIFYTWFRRFFRIEMNKFNIKKRNYYPYDFMSEIGKNKSKFGIDGMYINEKTVVMGTEMIEFKKAQDILYAGLCVESNRNENENFILPESKILFYCSLGTMSQRSGNTMNFYKALIEIFEKNTQWGLILSLGEKMKKIPITTDSPNIQILDYCNQTRIIPKVDIVISHGGYGTIKECIFFKKPMLLFFNSYDQNGNAAKIKYHKIGVISNMLKRDSIERIFGISHNKISKKNLEKLLQEITDDKYRRNIEQLYDKISQADEFEKFIKNII